MCSNVMSKAIKIAWFKNISFQSLSQLRWDCCWETGQAVKLLLICFCNSDTLTLELIAGARRGGKKTSSRQRGTVCVSWKYDLNTAIHSILKLNWCWRQSACWQPLHSTLSQRCCWGLESSGIDLCHWLFSDVLKERQVSGGPSNLIGGLIITVQPRWEAR